jgi:ethanolamine utilization protein EutP (predicted NTPase)
MQGVQGLAGIAGGIIGSRSRKQEQRNAQAEYERRKADYQSLDTSNPYLNQENVYEDLTVNTQEADYIAAQQNQGMANTMDALQQSAGGSGIAALAQSMANQQTSNAQQAAVSIGQQEASNQAAERQMAAQLKQQEIQGAYQSRAQEKDKVDTMFGMAQQRLGAANAARDAATSSIIGGVTGLAGAAVGSGVGSSGGFSMDKLMGG